MKEWLTIVNEKREPLGAKLRDEVHRDGDWHETFHCWFVEKSEETYLYFQKRAADKQDFPGLYDITAAGHIAHGEEREAAGLREIEEEIGIVLTMADLMYQGYYQGVYESPGFVDREFFHVYFHITKTQPSFQPGPEVASMMKISTTQLQRVLQGEEATAYALGDDVIRPMTVQPAQFCPHEVAYYTFILERIQ